MTLMGQPANDPGTPIYDQLVREMWPEGEPLSTPVEDADTQT